MKNVFIALSLTIPNECESYWNILLYLPEHSLTAAFLLKLKKKELESENKTILLVIKIVFYIIPFLLIVLLKMNNLCINLLYWHIIQRKFLSVFLSEVLP